MDPGVTEPAPIWSDAPRLAPERPLPGHRFVPGHTPRPTEALEPGFEFGIDLYHAGYLWEAHEAWEGVWKESRDPLVQGLIQMAASLLKRHLGNDRGARKLADRARSNLERAAAASPRQRGLDLPLLIAAWEACAAAPDRREAWSRAPRLMPR
jgi:predicted metal-dependent hydrolase